MGKISYCTCAKVCIKCASDALPARRYAHRPGGASAPKPGAVFGNLAWSRQRKGRSRPSPIATSDTMPFRRPSTTSAGISCLRCDGLRACPRPRPAGAAEGGPPLVRPALLGNVAFWRSASPRGWRSPRLVATQRACASDPTHRTIKRCVCQPSVHVRVEAEAPRFGSLARLQHRARPKAQPHVCTVQAASLRPTPSGRNSGDDSLCLLAGVGGDNTCDSHYCATTSTRCAKLDLTRNSKKR